MTDKRELGMGNVPVIMIDADGRENKVVLKPSLHAVRTLSRRYGGLQLVVDKIAKLDFDVIVDVLEAGLQVPNGNPKTRAELEASVYASGLSDQTGGLPTAAVKFVMILVNGGRVPPEDGALEAAQPNPPIAAS